MNRFSPKQTLSNITTAVRETVESVNKKSVVAAALATTFVLVLGESYVSAQAVRLQTPRTASAAETARIQAEAEAKARADLTRSYADREKEREANQRRLETLRPLRDAACKAADAPGADASLQYKCDDLSGEIDDISPGGARRAEQRERNKDRKQQECNLFADRVIRDTESATQACNKARFGDRLAACFDTIGTCQKDEQSHFDAEPEDEESTGAYCNKELANRCPGLSSLNDGRDYRQEEKEAHRDQKDAKAELQKLMTRQREEQMDLAKQQREMQENQQDEAAAARKAERALANQLKDSLEGLAANQKKAYESAQEAYNQMEVEYIKMRKEARDSVDAVDQAKDDLQVMCRASAEKKYAKAEEARLAALAIRKKNVGAGTNVSGNAKRTKAATARARLADYAAYFNECTSGSSADGVGGNNRIKTAERAKASANKLLADKAAMIEKQRTQMLDKLKAMEADATNQRSKIITDMNQKLEDMNQDRQIVAQKNAARAAEYSQRQQLTMQGTRQEIETANEELLKSQKEGMVATTRLACLGSQGTRSETRRDRVEEGFSTSLAAIDRASQSCKRLQNSCSTEDFPPLCNDIMSAAAGKGKRTKNSR